MRPLTCTLGLALLLLAALVACARPAERGEPAAPASQDASSAQGAAADTVVTLERTPCFGTCPSYTLAILSDGTVRYYGRRFVAVEGEATARIPTDSLRALVARFEAAGYFDLQSHYVSGDACETQMSDMPTVRTSLHVEGRAKTVTHYHGCRGFAKEQALTALENRIDAVAGTDRWIDGDQTDGS